MALDPERNWLALGIFLDMEFLWKFLLKISKSAACSWRRDSCMLCSPLSPNPLFASLTLRASLRLFWLRLSHKERGEKKIPVFMATIGAFANVGKGSPKINDKPFIFFMPASARHQ
ncbi:hypothetical protein [Alcanivorax quisquiliarum]|uniref:Uncharacterized protein n=1 Tax=Alcanivorax quisquiliarum TaxID=2933565 RepID=A0ABT0E9E2_9GAMM|nr:hypothetical protein [Alcanivorax quisquiliarum]MCK0538380.1 hypothetical protein [Alcanivorax quisquiliarum]